MQYSEELRKKRQQTIVDGVRDAIFAKRASLGHPELMPNTILGMSALYASGIVAETNNVTDELVHATLREAAGQGGYGGFIAAAYHKEFWDADSSDDLIIKEMSETLHRQFSRFAWEDRGIGICAAFLESGRFGVTIVIAIGAVDGSAQTVAGINKARLSKGSAPLHLNYPLRKLAREYINRSTFPDKKRIEDDIIQSGYVEPGHVFQCAYLGTETVVHRDNDEIPVDKLGNAAANALLQEYGGLLLRSDWQDIGIATRNWSSTTSPSSNNVQVEFVIAWALPEGVERPTHFPPPIGKEPSDKQQLHQDGETIQSRPYRPHQLPVSEPKRRRRWWPF